MGITEPVDRARVPGDMCAVEGTESNRTGASSPTRQFPNNNNGEMVIFSPIIDILSDGDEVACRRGAEKKKKKKTQEIDDKLSPYI